MKRSRPGNPGLKGRLLDKSVEAYVLALETINRLTVQYRLETFCYLICNAWELLLKTKIIEDKGTRHSIYCKEQPGQPKRSLSLRTCLCQVMPNDDPIRRNIERIAELRDEAVHLVVSKIPSDVICLFQACVINYHDKLNGWFGVSLADRVPVGMMSIVYDTAPDQWDMSNKRLRRELGKDTAMFLARYCAEIRQEFDSLQEPVKFLIPIGYSLALTKKIDDGDIVLSQGQTGVEPTQIVQLPKDPSRSHPFRQKEVLENIKERIPDLGVNQYDLQCVNRVCGIKKRSQFFYQGTVKNSPAQYSQLFVDWLVDQYNRDKSFFEKAKAEAKEMRSSKPAARGLA